MRTRAPRCCDEAVRPGLRARDPLPVVAQRCARATCAGAMLLAAVLATPAARAGTTGCDDLRGGERRFDVSWQDEIKPILNTMYGGRCTGCHFAGRTPDLSDSGVDAIYKIVGSYVIPGRPLDSGLFDKVNCAQPYVGERMPLDGTPLTLAEQALIYDWIAAGARGEPKATIPRTFLFRDGMESMRWY